MKRAHLLSFTVAAASIWALGAAESKEETTYLDPAQAGPDYADQGEYKNDWGGAQVIALGKDTFQLVIYPGGLPGEGWDQQRSSIMQGKREGDVIKFKGDREGWTQSVSKGVFTTTTDQGATYVMDKISRKSPTLGAKPPPGAVVLFDGTNADQWQGGHVDERHLLAAGTTSKKAFGNYTLHAEFMTPFKPSGRGQGRGNSGVYMQDRYEVQVLDSFGLKGEDNECGGIYSKSKPKVNMCYPPLTWQTYDIDFTAAQFDGAGKKTKNAVITVKHNGVVIHDKQEISGPTGGGKPEGPTPGPIQLQGHGNPVYYRNIWVVEK